MYYICIHLLDVSIRYLKYFCVLFVYAVSFIAMLHLHLWWFYYCVDVGDQTALSSPYSCTVSDGKVQKILWEEDLSIRGFIDPLISFLLHLCIVWVIDQEVVFSLNSVAHLRRQCFLGREVHWASELSFLLQWLLGTAVLVWFSSHHPYIVKILTWENINWIHLPSFDI